ncbi:MAG: YraN family protein [Chloroflexi bacterium]|nr:YraN family protein [Chloroflexota bacterium]MBT5628063.1 YraN family protein [Chloroflexota bacterium]
MSNSSGKLNLPHGTGRAGEAAARSFVSIELGLDIAQCNFRTREGEIDIIAKSGVEYIFFEVKTRTNKKFGSGVEQISARKALRLQTTGQRYLEQIGAENADWRIDLLSVEMDKTGRVQKVTHVENAIEEQS